MLPTDSAAYLSLPYLSEAVPGTFCGGVRTYHKRRVVGNRPPICGREPTTHTAAAAAQLAILDEGGDAAERVPLPPSPLRFELWTVQQTLRPGMVNVHIRTSVMLQNVSGVWGARYMAR